MGLFRELNLIWVVFNHFLDLCPENLKNCLFLSWGNDYDKEKSTADEQTDWNLEVYSLQGKPTYIKP